MAGGIKKVMGSPFHLNLVSADVLGDAAGLALVTLVLRMASKGGLAVVDVAHDHHDGAAGLEVPLPSLSSSTNNRSSMVTTLPFHLGADFPWPAGGGVVVDHLGDRSHDAYPHQPVCRQYLSGGDFQAQGHYLGRRR